MIRVELELTAEETRLLAGLVGWGGHQALLSKLYAERPEEKAAGEKAYNLAQAVEAKLMAHYLEEVNKQ